MQNREARHRGCLPSCKFLTMLPRPPTAVSARWCAMRHQPGKGSYTVSSTRTENPYVQCFPDHADAGVNVARSVHVAPADAGDFAARSVRVAPAYAGDFAARRLAPSAG